MLKEWLKNYGPTHRMGKLIKRKQLLKANLPNWASLIAANPTLWQQAQTQAQDGPNILLATSVGAFWPAMAVESLLGVALTLRGAKIHTLLCDAVLPACLDCDNSYYPNPQQFINHGPSQDLCQFCFNPAQAVYESLDFVTHRYSDLLSAEQIQTATDLATQLSPAEIEAYTWQGMAIGEHTLAGTLRFYARATLTQEPLAEAVLRRYFKAALLTTFATQALFAKVSFTAAVFHHGIYVPQGLIGEVARQAQVRVINWNAAYRKQCFIFSHNDTYHHTFMSEPVTNWETLPWDKPIETTLMTYLASRWQGTQDWIWFHENPQRDLAAITQEIGIDFNKPCIGLLTNVMWDAQLHYPANAFANMLDWVLKTIDYFTQRPDLQLLIRIHPAEIRGTLRSRQPLLAEIHRTHPTLAPNIFIIPPESQVSTYAAMQACNAVIIYGTKTGVELTSMGIPVIVAGEAWIRNKGITLDATSTDTYFAHLDQLPLPERMPTAQTERARKYAYHFFFRRMIPLNFFDQATGGRALFKLTLNNLNALLPGTHPGLDIVCQGILTGSEFIYPAENLPHV
jgi:hypothetical protein